MTGRLNIQHLNGVLLHMVKAILDNELASSGNVSSTTLLVGKQREMLNKYLIMDGIKFRHKFININCILIYIYTKKKKKFDCPIDKKI